MVIVIDNYDSFVYNLAQYLGELGWEPAVHRNDQITLAQIESLSPSHIIISPGPGTPLDAGISNDVIRHFTGRVPMIPGPGLYLLPVLGCHCIHKWFTVFEEMFIANAEVI